MSVVAHTRPPAKLNLFLELLAKRRDGYHDIDTVMVPIDWCDELHVTRHQESAVRLVVRWLPSQQTLAQRLGIELNGENRSKLLDVPTGAENLVHRALTKFLDAFELKGGFDCLLNKSIPSGAGMGGASSDAASALRSAAALCNIPAGSRRLYEIAEQIGSDVPFFLGLPAQPTLAAGRAQGRGERLSQVKLPAPLDFVVVYPAISLSTGAVYAESQIPPSPRNTQAFIESLETGRLGSLGNTMTNRLTEPAKKLAPQIAETLESLWQVGLQTCQLTGSGSACFAIAGSRQEAMRCSERLRGQLEPGAIVMPARSLHVPAWVNLA